MLTWIRWAFAIWSGHLFLLHPVWLQYIRSGRCWSLILNFMWTWLISSTFAILFSYVLRLTILLWLFYFHLKFIIYILFWFIRWLLIFNFFYSLRFCMIIMSITFLNFSSGKINGFSSLQNGFKHLSFFHVDSCICNFCFCITSNFIGKIIRTTCKVLSLGCSNDFFLSLPLMLNTFYLNQTSFPFFNSKIFILIYTYFWNFTTVPAATLRICVNTNLFATLDHFLPRTQPCLTWAFINFILWTYHQIWRSVWVSKRSCTWIKKLHDLLIVIYSSFGNCSFDISIVGKNTLGLLLDNLTKILLRMLERWNYIGFGLVYLTRFTIHFNLFVIF